MSEAPQVPPIDFAARTTRVAVLGLGYVGLPLALLFVEAGFPVLGLDIDPEKVAALNAGRSYIQRIPPADITTALSKGFRATTSFADLHTCDAILLESTTWPGTTTELVLPLLERLGPTKVHRDTPSTLYPLPSTLCLLAFSPEREDPGNTTTPRRAIPKVIGGVSAAATTAAAALYGAVFDQTVQMSSPAAAEMTKLLENIYRSVNIALVNELKQLCMAMKIDIWEVIEAASTKPFGFQPFYPGPGIGGHCIPVDPFYLSWRAQQFQQPTRFIALAGEINEAMPAFVVSTVQKALGTLTAKRILLLGIAYKRDLDDLRESPALTLFSLLEQAGAEVRYNDPYLPHVTEGRHYRIHQTSTPLDQVPTFDAVLLVTDHTAYDIPTLVAASRLFVDTRNATRHLTAPNILRC